MPRGFFLSALLASQAQAADTFAPIGEWICTFTESSLCTGELCTPVERESPIRFGDRFGECDTSLRCDDIADARVARGSTLVLVDAEGGK